MPRNTRPTRSRGNRNRRRRGGGGGNSSRRRRRGRDDRRQVVEQENEFEERIVAINRVAKVHKGGRRFRFTALVVVGDGKGRVGAAQGKAGGVPEAIRKAIDQAKKQVITVPLVGSTIPHEILGVGSSSRVLLKPASPGTGVIAGGPVRAVAEVAGIKDLLTKCLGSANKLNTVYATLDGLRRLKVAEEVAAARGKSVGDLPIPSYFRQQEVLAPHEQAVESDTEEEPDRLFEKTEGDSPSAGADETPANGDAAEQPGGEGDGGEGQPSG